MTFNENVENCVYTLILYIDLIYLRNLSDLSDDLFDVSTEGSEANEVTEVNDVSKANEANNLFNDDDNDEIQIYEADLRLLFNGDITSSDIIFLNKINRHLLEKITSECNVYKSNHLDQIPEFPESQISSEIDDLLEFAMSIEQEPDIITYKKDTNMIITMNDLYHTIHASDDLSKTDILPLMNVLYKSNKHNDSYGVFRCIDELSINYKKPINEIVDILDHLMIESS